MLVVSAATPYLPVLLAALVFAGCDPVGEDPDGGDGDADGDGDGDVEQVPPPQAPEEPTAPTLTPCPEGWTEVPAGEELPATCSPWPEGEPDLCGADEAHFPGEPGCARIGPACPAGDWSEELPAEGSVLFVLGTAAEGGDGTRAAPYRSIGEALSAASEGTIVAVGKGAYEGSVQLPAGVTLWGACVAETILSDPSTHDWNGVVTVAGEGTTVRSLQITGRRPGLSASGNRSVHMEDVLVLEAEDAGVLIDYGARVTATGLVVRGTRSRVSDGLMGRGIDVEAGEIELDRCSIEGSRTNGIFIIGADSSAHLEQVAITGTRGRLADLYEGTGLDIAEGASVEGQALAIHGNRHAGLFLRGEGSEAVVSSVVISHTRADESDGQGGHGMRVTHGARLEATRVVIYHSRDAGVLTSDGGAEVVLTDFVVRDTFSSEGDGLYGVGLLAQTASSMELARGHVQRSRHSGVLAAWEDTELVAEDLTILDVTVEDDGTDDGIGAGLVAVRGATVDAGRVRVARADAVGVVVGSTGTRATLRDISVGPSRAGGAPFPGRGMHCYGGAFVHAERMRLEHCTEAGLVAFSPDTVVELVDLVISEVAEFDCGFEGCASAGIGLGSYAGASIDVSRFLIEEAPLVGIQIALGLGEPTGYEGPGSLDLHDGEVSQNAIGVNIQVPGYDLSRLEDHVIYRDNGTDLDMASMPSPGVGEYELD